MIRLRDTMAPYPISTMDGTCSNDLYNGDIPIFTTCPISHAIRASSGETVDHFIEETGMDRVKSRIKDLNEDQIAKHNWFIKASLVTLTGIEHKVLPAANLNIPKKTTLYYETLHDRLVGAACAIGGHLLNIALDEDESLNWLSLSPRGEIGDRWIITPLGVDLYSGILGVILLFAYLAIITHNARYKHACYRALKTLRRLLLELKLRPELLNIGAFTGWGGVIYVLSHLGYIWNDTDSICEANTIAELLPSLINNDKRYDVIAGCAGCIGALLALYKCTLSNRILEIACMCGNHIVNNAKIMNHGVGWIIDAFSDQPLSGFSHGAAGFAWSLLELYNVTKNKLFLEIAQKGIEYERALYDQNTHNWFDLRRAYHVKDGSDSTMSIVQNAWCHGAPGIGMARLKAYKYLPQNEILSEINIALESTSKFGFGGYNHSLCHGVLGNLELFIQAREILGTVYDSEVTKIAVTILDSIDKNGWQCATPLGVETPSFMVGLSGIGYQLLRIANPKIIPSVLMLEPPI
jgi:type 2 lantibiotic biosynthesis protein LanM